MASDICLKIVSVFSESCLCILLHELVSSELNDRLEFCVAASDSFAINAVAGTILGMTNVSFISDEYADKSSPSFTPVARNPTVFATKGF